jgi:hypothetical protein
MHLRCIYLAVLVLGIVTESASAIVTSDTSGSHIVTPGQPAFGLNLDGVGFLGWNLFGVDIPIVSGVLIGDRDVLTVAHGIVDEAGNDVLFDTTFGPDVEAGAVFDTHEGRHSLALVPEETHYFADYFETGRDLAVVRLAEDAPASIPRYPIYAGGSELGQPIVIAGYGAAGHGATGMDAMIPDDPFDLLTDRRAGLNRFEAFAESLILPPDLQLEETPPGILLVSDFDSGDAAHNFLAVHGPGSDLGFGSDEVSAAAGDSGGPAFIGSSVGGIMTAVGSFGDTDITPGIDDSSWGEATLYVRLSAFRDFLTTATEGRAVFVPEPPTLILALLVLTGLATSRKTGRQSLLASDVIPGRFRQTETDSRRALLNLKVARPAPLDCIPLLAAVSLAKSWERKSVHPEVALRALIFQEPRLWLNLRRIAFLLVRGISAREPTLLDRWSAARTP